MVKNSDRRHRRRIAFCGIAVLALALLVVFSVAVNREVVRVASEGNILECGETPNKRYDAIVVLGAGLQADGSPSHMLEDRLKTAVALYAEGISDTVVLSGDNSGESYDEVSAMVRYCLDNGIPEESIIRDDKGFSTYETVDNVVGEMELGTVILVTQKYHLYRAVYLARMMGADADGASADYRTYRGQVFRDLREYAARIKDCLIVNLPNGR